MNNETMNPLSKSVFLMGSVLIMVSAALASDKEASVALYHTADTIQISAVVHFEDVSVPHSSRDGLADTKSYLCFDYQGTSVRCLWTRTKRSLLGYDTLIKADEPPVRLQAGDTYTLIISKTPVPAEAHSSAFFIPVLSQVYSGKKRLAENLHTIIEVPPPNHALQRTAAGCRLLF